MSTMETLIGHRRIRRKPGPKGVLKNPRPVDYSVIDDEGREFVSTTDEVGPHQLGPTESDLRAYFRERCRELVVEPGEALGRAKTRICKLAVAALSQSESRWWSGLVI